MNGSTKVEYITFVEPFILENTYYRIDLLCANLNFVVVSVIIKLTYLLVQGGYMGHR